MLLREYAIKWWFIIPPHLTNVSALPRETWTRKLCLFSTHVSSPGECGWLRACGKARGRHFEHLQLTGSVQSHPSRSNARAWMNRAARSPPFHRFPRGGNLGLPTAYSTGVPEKSEGSPRRRTPIRLYRPISFGEYVFSINRSESELINGCQYKCKLYTCISTYISGLRPEPWRRPHNECKVEQLQ